MKVWLAENLLTMAYRLVRKDADNRSDAIRFAVLNYFLRWRDAPPVNWVPPLPEVKK